MEKNEQRHVKEIIEDDETITIIYEKDENFEGITIKESDIPDEGPEEEIEEGPEEEIEEEEEEEYERSNIWTNPKQMEKRFYNINGKKK